MLIEAVSILDPELIKRLHASRAKNFEQNLVLEILVVVGDALSGCANIKEIRACGSDDLFGIVHIVAEIKKVESVDKVDPANDFVSVEHEQHRHLDQALTQPTEERLLVEVASGALLEDGRITETLQDKRDTLAHAGHLPYKMLHLVAELVKPVELHTLGVD